MRANFIGWFWLSVALGLFALLRSEAVTAAPLRYLFVVETSSAMSAQKEVLLRTLTDQLASGLNNQMHNGDTFIVWTFDHDVRTDRYFPAAWNRRSRELLARRTARSVGEIWFSGDARLDRAMAEVQRLVKHSEALTIVILTTGTSALVGTPFDEPVNAAYVPGGLFVTKLLARSGQIEGWSVERLSGPLPSAPQPLPAITAAPVSRDEVKSVSKPLPGAPAIAQPVVSPKVVAEPPPAVAAQKGSRPPHEVGQAAHAVDQTLAITPASQQGELSGELVLGMPGADDAMELAMLPSTTPAAEPLLGGSPTTQTKRSPQLQNTIQVHPKAPQPEINPARDGAAHTAPSSAAVAQTATTQTNTTVRQEVQLSLDRKPTGAQIDKKVVTSPVRPQLSDPQSASPVYGRGFLMMGLALLIVALAGLYCYLRGRAPAEQASLISRSIGLPKG
jgi:hypothetical protein